MDFRLVPSMGWQAVVILYAVLSLVQGQFPPSMNQNGPAQVLDEKPVNITAKAGSTARLPCHVINSGTSGVTWSTKDYETTIYSQKLILVDKQRFSVDTSYKDEWNLVIDNVQPEDAGVYTCMTTTFPPQFKQITLIVPAPPNIDRSALKAKYIVEEWGSLMVKCIATGFPEPDIKWFKYTPGLAMQDEQKELFSSTNTLTIANLKRGDGNIYGCTAVNSHGSDMYEIFVDIVYKPELSTETRTIKVNNLDNVKLECIVDSNPAARVGWYKNGKQLQTSWKYFLENLDNLPSESKKTLRLTVQKTDLDDVGDYTCRASNAVGASQIAVSILIQDTTTAPSTSRSTTTQPTPPPPTTQRVTKGTVKTPSTPLQIEETPQTGKSHNGTPVTGHISITILMTSLVLSLLAVFLS